MTALLALAFFAFFATLDIPFMRQTTAACGPASAAMVAQYWARERPDLRDLAVEAERIARAPIPPKGATGADLKRLLEQAGFRVFVFSGEPRDLHDHLAKGRPLIVCFAPAGKRAPLHFAVVAGIEDDAIVLNDPTRGKLFREDLSRFLTQWSATGNWALLAVPRDTP